MEHFLMFTDHWNKAEKLSKWFDIRVLNYYNKTEMLSRSKTAIRIIFSRQKSFFSSAKNHIFPVLKLSIWVDKSSLKMPHWSILASFRKLWACGQTVLPDWSFSTGQNRAKNDIIQKFNATFWGIFKHCDLAVKIKSM